MFAEDPRIQMGDPILIYFSGHGGTGQREEALYGKTVLLPYDYSMDKQESGITDLELNGLLADLADKRGNNIVRACFLGRLLCKASTFRP